MVVVLTGAVPARPSDPTPRAAATSESVRETPAAGPSAAAAVRPVIPWGLETHTVWHWNVAGNTFHGGSVTGGLVDAVVSSIVTQGADLVSLNELCQQQYEAVGTRLREAGWLADPTTSSAFQPTLSGIPTLCQGQAVGIAVFTVRPVSAVDRVELPWDGSPERRALLCVGMRDAPQMRFCTTHITTRSTVSPATGRPHNIEQLGVVLDRLEAYHAAGDTVVIAGDFNAQPHYHRLDGWYASRPGTAGSEGNRGSYRELDDSDGGHCFGYGEWTATGPPGAVPACASGVGAPCTAGSDDGCAKIDLVFVRQDRIVGAYDADALDIPHSCPGVPSSPSRPAGACSDHRALTGTVTVRVQP